VLWALEVEDASLLSLAGVSPLEDELSLLLLFVFVAVAAADVVCAAAASALVFVGGVMSGVFVGTESDTLLLPQALSASAHSSAAHAASALRALTAVPCACRRWGSR